MVPVELGTKNNCAGEGQQQFSRQGRLSQLRVSVVGSEKLVAEVGDSSGTQR
jgi:hypothetical protein